MMAFAHAHWGDIEVGGDAMTHEKTRTTRHSNNSIDSGGIVGVNHTLSENEGGYLSDVSNSESPPPDLVTHYRRRSKLPDTNPVNGSVSDTDDDNIRFERKPPRGKSSRRRSRQPTDDEPKIVCYNGARKRFSWTDSGVSSSMGTGPHSKKLSCGSIIAAQIEKSKSTEDVSGIKNIVHDAFNAVNELKDLQRSFKRTHSEHKLCKFFSDSNKSKPDFQNCFHDLNSYAPPSDNQETTHWPTSVNIESQQRANVIDTSICNKDTSLETSSYDNFSLEDIINDLQITNNDGNEQENLQGKASDDIPITPQDSLTVDHFETIDTTSSDDCIGFNPSPLKISIDADDDKNQEIFRTCPDSQDNYTTYTDIVSQQAHTVPVPPNLAADSRSSKSKAFFSGLRKVASHLKPSSLRTGTTPTFLSKDVSSEFSYAKRKNDEDTIQQLHTITSKFREEITHIQNLSINNLTADDDELNNITTVDGTAKTSSDDDEVTLDRLAVKQSAPSFMDKVFNRRRSYNAMAVNEKKEKEKKRASFCDNVFISPCYGNYSPVSDSYKLVGRREARMRSGSGIGSCSFSSTSSLTFNEDDEVDPQNTSFLSCGIEDRERQRVAIPPIPPLPPPPPPPPPQQSQPQINISFHGSDITLPDDCISITNSNSCQSLRGHHTSCGYSPSLQVHTGAGSEIPNQQHDCPQCAYADYLNYVQFLHLRETGYMWPHLGPYGGNYYGNNSVPFGSNGFNYYQDHYQQCSESSSYPTNGNDCIRNGIDVVIGELSEPVSEEAALSHENCCYGDEEIVDSEYGTYV